MGKRGKISVIVCLCFFIVVAVVQASGLGDYIRDHTPSSCQGGTCAMKFYKNHVKNQ